MLPLFESIPFAEFKKNGRECVRVVVELFKGSTVNAVRVWYRDQAGELRPGRSGISMAIKHLPALAEGLVKALAWARERGLFDDGGIK
jgi:hypothetical protein